MTKKLKVAFLACLTLCIALFAFVFAACDGGNGGDGGENTNDNILTYSVTLKYEDGSVPVAAEGSLITVQLCIMDDNGNQVMCLNPVQIDENGTAEIVADLDAYEGVITADTIFHIQVNRLPGYDTSVEGVDPITRGFDAGVTEVGTYEYEITLVDRS